MAQQSFEDIAAAVKQAESGGKRYAADGKTLTTSAKGALGEMQVMPKTIRSPGFGVEPAKNKSPDEIARVGKDYLQAMLSKYGDRDKALIAYNMGPGSTDKWIAAGEKMEKLPEETRMYVQRVNRFLGKNVSRETPPAPAPAVKPREPLPPSLPPMAEAPAPAPVLAAMPVAERVAALGPGYQAALALSFLADTDDGYEEGDTTQTQEFMAQRQEEQDAAEEAALMQEQAARPAVLAELSNTKIRSPFAEPVMMAKGGEITQEEIDAANRPALFNPNIRRQGEAARKLAAMRDVNTLSDPQTYAFIQGILGETPDQLGFSVMHPDYKKIIGRGEQGMITGGVSMIGPAARALKGLAGMGVKTLKPAASAAEISKDYLQRQKAMSSGPDGAARMAVAQRNAALPIEQGGLGLPANNTAMDRAAAMGFDTDVFHGTSKDFLTFNPDKEVFAAELPEIANLYGKFRKGDGQRILPLKIRGTQLTISDMDKSGNNNLFGYNLAKKLNLSDDEIEKLLIPPVRYPSGELIPGVEKYVQIFSDQGEREIINRLPKYGIDRLKVTDMSDMGGLQTQYMLPAGSDNVRSRFAAFDPFRRTAAVAAAMGAAAPDLLAGQEQKETEVNRAEDSSDGGEARALMNSFVNRAEGGEAAPTQEEIDAASTPAFIAQKSGIGRKAGPVSQALNSGDAYIAAAKGFTNLPYNIAGAPMDIAMLLRQGLTGQAPAGQVGTSEYIKKKATEMGIRPAPPTDPTLAGFYDAGDLGSNLVNPAGATRAGVRAAGTVAQKTGEAARDFQQYNQQLSVPGASYAVRNKGTPFIMGYGRTEGPDGKFPAMDQAEKYIKLDVATTKDPKLNDWLSSRLTSYLRRDFATPDDQFVKAADANQLLHFVNKPIPKRPDLDPYNERISDFLSIDSLPYVRKTQGFKAEGEAKTEYGKRAETLTDASAWPLQLDDITSPGLIPPGMRDMVKTDPTARLTELGVNVDEMLQFDKLAGDMERMRSMPKVYSAYSQPGIKVPEEYLLTDKMLIGLTPAQASNRVAKFRNWEEENRQRMASKVFFEDPTIDRTPAEGGGVWVNPGNLEERPGLLKLVQDVGCDGGWCTREEATALSYGSGENRLSILMDSKARPQAQLTITSREYGADDFVQSMGQSEYDAFQVRYPNIAAYSPLLKLRNENAIMGTPEFQQWRTMNPDSFLITEIKGVNNQANLQSSPYLKQIQQQVKDLDAQFNLQGVENLDGIGMKKLFKGVRDPQFFNAQTEIGNETIRLNNGSQYINKDDFNQLYQQAFKNVSDAYTQQRAKGGMVERQSTDNRRYL